MTLQRIRFFAVCTLTVTLFIILLGNSTLAMDGVRHGLSLCLETVFPALFPFLVLSELFVACGAGDVVGKFLGRPIAALFGLSREGACAVLLGALCGQPVASTAALSLCARGELEERELERICLFANNPSSGFLIAVVGGALFGNMKAGVALFCITVISAAVVGGLLHLFFGKVGDFQKKPLHGIEKSLSITSVTGAISRAFFTLLQVCAFLLFFCALAACLCAPLQKFAPVWRVLLSGMLELTGGISAAASALPPTIAFRFAAFFASFAGFSVCLQILSITEGKGVRPWLYLMAKLMQGGIALVLCQGYLYFFRPVLCPANSVTTGTLPSRFPSFIIMIVLLVLCIFVQKSRSLKKEQNQGE